MYPESKMNIAHKIVGLPITLATNVVVGILVGFQIAHSQADKFTLFNTAINDTMAENIYEYILNLKNKAQLIVLTSASETCSSNQNQIYSLKVY